MPVSDCYKKIAGDLYNDCRDDYGKGMGTTAYYIDDEDIERKTSTRTDNVISNIVLKSGAKAIRLHMPSKDPFNGTTNEDQNVAIGQAFNKTVPVVMLADSPENALKITAFKNRKGVVVYENKAKGTNGEQAFVVVGWEQGVFGQNATLDKYGDETQGGWRIDLIEEGAQTPQIFFFKTDYDTTKAALESLCD